jgi:hypothetical protein
MKPTTDELIPSGTSQATCHSLAKPTQETTMYRIIRTIVTNKGRLVRHEAALQCPLPGAGPQVEMATWGVAACVAETP